MEKLKENMKQLFEQVKKEREEQRIVERHLVEEGLVALKKGNINVADVEQWIQKQCKIQPAQVTLNRIACYIKTKYLSKL